MCFVSRWLVALCRRSLPPQAMVLDAPDSLQVVSLEEGHVVETDRVVVGVSCLHRGFMGEWFYRLLLEGCRWFFSRRRSLFSRLASLLSVRSVVVSIQGGSV